MVVLIMNFIYSFKIFERPKRTAVVEWMEQGKGRNFSPQNENLSAVERKT